MSSPEKFENNNEAPNLKELIPELDTHYMGGVKPEILEKVNERLAELGYNEVEAVEVELPQGSIISLYPKNNDHIELPKKE